MQSNGVGGGGSSMKKPKTKDNSLHAICFLLKQCHGGGGGGAGSSFNK